LQRRRRDARDEALAALGGRRYLRLHDAIDRLLAEPPLTRRAKRPASAELARSVNRAWRRTERRMLAADRTHGRVNRDRALHETRKAAKRLRYAVEVAVPAGGRSANRFRKRLKEMHRVLGEHQDSVVCRPVIRELGARAHSERGNGFTFGLLYGLESAHADRIDVALPPVWERLSRKKSIRWFSRR
jgi:CHAD domain-containing protein